MPEHPPPPDDPLDLEAADLEVRINELSERVKDIGMSSFHMSDDCPPDLHEQFLRNVLDYESAPVSSHFQQLIEAGIDLPAPDSLDDAALHAKLWEVINALASREVFLSRTDHMSDRQLYEHLWTDTLREEGHMMPPGSGWVCDLDMLGSCSEEDLQNNLRYYDDEETRRRWAKDFPSDVIPPHEDPPYDRDKTLPRQAPQLGRPWETQD